MKFELVFIPSPAAGHLKSTVEVAKLLVGHDDRLSITVVIIVPSRFSDDKFSSYIASLSAASDHRLRYTVLPIVDQSTSGQKQTPGSYIESQKPNVRAVVAKLVDPTQSDSPRRLAGLVVDMFCTAMMDVADEFGVPTYLFYTSNAGFLGLNFHVRFLYDEKKFDVSDLKDSDTKLDVPCLTRPLPAKSLPSVLLRKDFLPVLVEHARRFRETKGILVNTFAELEPHALKILSGGDTPPVYPVGPLLDLKTDDQDSGDENRSEILRWLDEQPPRSVVFLCFGSMGSFTEEQAKETAVALERSGHRFLWSLRRMPPNGTMRPPEEFTNLDEVLPEGFLDRTAKIGKIIGWAPQVAVLANPAIGGFVTHCGWNSTLESLWFGVPTATWPLYAEQQFNAFAMVEELGLAVEIAIDSRGDFMVGDVGMVTAEKIERGIRCLMEQDSLVRKKVKDMSEKSRVALMEGGSSRVALGKFIKIVVDNISFEN